MRLKEMINMKPLQVTKGSDLGHALWRTLRSYRADAADPETRSGMRFRSFSSDAFLRRARQVRAYITSSTHPDLGYSTLQPTKLSKKLINNQMKRMQKRNPQGYYPMAESTYSERHNLLEISDQKIRRAQQASLDRAEHYQHEINKLRTRPEFMRDKELGGHPIYKPLNHKRDKVVAHLKSGQTKVEAATKVRPGTYHKLGPHLGARDEVASRSAPGFFDVNQREQRGVSHIANAIYDLAPRRTKNEKRYTRFGQHRERMNRIPKAAEKVAETPNLLRKAAIGAGVVGLGYGAYRYHKRKQKPVTESTNACFCALMEGAPEWLRNIKRQMKTKKKSTPTSPSPFSTLRDKASQVRQKAADMAGDFLGDVLNRGMKRLDYKTLRDGVGDLAGAAGEAASNKIGQNIINPVRRGRYMLAGALGAAGVGGLLYHRHRQKRAKQLPPVIESERLKGGLGDNKPDKAFPREQLRRGMKVEREHTRNPRVAKEIAKDHLSEFRDYYTRLAVMERRAKKGKKPCTA